ncbi:hypothetical protein Tco_0231079 [Tanacetum coccineum]
MACNHFQTATQTKMLKENENHAHLSLTTINLQLLGLELTQFKKEGLFEPDADDELWKSQKHIHDVTWRLYDTCGVHRVSIKDGVDIYMLVERGYPLLRGVLTQMLVAKLLVDQDNEMSRELLRKIFMQEERPRR